MPGDLVNTRRDRAAQAIADWFYPYPMSVEDMASAYEIADMLLAEVDRVPDVSEVLDAWSLGTPEVKAVPHEMVQRVVCNARLRPGDETTPVCDLEAGHARPHRTGHISWPVGPPHPPAYLLEQAQKRQASHQTGDGAVSPGGGASPLARGAATASSPLMTDGRAAAPPADVPGVPTPSAAESANATAVLPSVLPRSFLLFRTRDVTGLSGSGVVAWGCEWPDKTVSLRWATAHPSTVHWDNKDELLAVHGHTGATVICWLKASLYPGEA